MYFHHKLQAEYEGSFRWGDQSVPVYTNSLGFKDRAVRDIPMASDRQRLLFIGDSFTFGVGYPYEKTFVGLIDKAYSSEGAGVEVLNAGVTSYSAAIYYWKVRYLLEGLGLNFDELHVYFDISDGADTIRHEGRLPLPPNDRSSWRLIKNRVDLFLKENSLLYRIILRDLIEMAIHSLREKLSNAAVPSSPPRAPERNNPATTVAGAAGEIEPAAPPAQPTKEVVCIVADCPWATMAQFYKEVDKWTIDPELHERWGKRGRWIHISSATVRFLRKASAGVLNPRHFLGVELMAQTRSAMSWAL